MSAAEERKTIMEENEKLKLALQAARQKASKAAADTKQTFKGEAEFKAREEGLVKQVCLPACLPVYLSMCKQVKRSGRENRQFGVMNAYACTCTERIDMKVPPDLRAETVHLPGPRFDCRPETVGPCTQSGVAREGYGSV